MNMNASRNMTKSSKSTSAARNKKNRSKKWSTNKDRVSWRENSGNSKSLDEKPNEKKTNKIITNKAYEDHKRNLEFLKPFLETLPSKTLHNPAKDMVSLVLSIAI